MFAKKEKKVKRIWRMLALIMAVTLFVPVLNVSAQSWLELPSGTQEMYYGDPDSSKYNDDMREGEPPMSGLTESLMEVLSWIPGGVGLAIEKLILESGPLQFSIDSLVYGRMNGSEVMGEGNYVIADFFHFGLEPNNPWGIIGSTVFFASRTVCYGLLPITVLVLLIWYAFNRSPENRKKLKDTLIHLVFSFMILWATPYFLDVIIKIRDGAMYVMRVLINSAYTNIGGVYVTGGGVTDHFYEQWRASMDIGGGYALVYAALYIASVFAVLFYFGHYIVIAALLCVCFGFLPIGVIISFFKPKILSEWWDIVFPNLLLQLVDMVLFLIPTGLGIVYQAVFSGKAGVESGKTVLCIIILVFLWNAITIRNKVIEWLGFRGIQSQGIWDAIRGAAIASRLMHMSGGGSRSAGSRGGGGGDPHDGGGNFADTVDEAKRMEEAGKRMLDADRDISRAASEMAPPDFYSSANDMADARSVDDLLERMDAEAEAQIAEADADSTPQIEGLSSNTPSVSTDGPLESEVEVPENAGGVRVEEMVGDMPQSAPDGTIEQVSAGGVPTTGEQGEGYSFEASRSVEVGLPQADARHAYSVDGRIAGSDSLQGTSKEFRDGLSEGDRMRYDNLYRMEDCQRQIARNESRMARAGYNSGTYSSTIQEYTDQSKRLTSHIDRLNSDYDRVSADKGLSDEARSTELSRISNERGAAMEALKHNESRIEDLRTASKLAKQNTLLKDHVDHCKAVERGYASNREMAGMNGRQFNGASDYERYVSHVDNIRKQQMDFRNFDAPAYKGMLSPTQKAEFLRQRALEQAKDQGLSMRTVGRGALKVGKGVARVGVSAVAGVAMAYGGPMASTYGVIGANMLANKANINPGQVSNAVKASVANAKRAGKAVSSELPKRAPKEESAEKRVRREGREANKRAKEAQTSYDKQVEAYNEEARERAQSGKLLEKKAPKGK